MSLINKMLQELDNRRAVPSQPAPAESPQVAQNVRAVKPQRAGSEMFWRVMAGIMIVAVAWVIWVVWQIMPRSAVTELAYQSANRARPQQPAAKSVAAPVAPAPVIASTQPAVAPAPAVPAPQAAPSPGTTPIVAAPAIERPAATVPAAAKEAPKIDMLRLATEMATPSASRARSAPTAKSPDRQTTAALKAQGQAPKAPDRPLVAATKPPPVVATSKPPPQARSGGTPSDSGRIDKRADATPRQRAESEFQRAMAQVNQGRMAEGMDGLRAALAADPSYEVARQTFVALLLEAKRTDEAATALQEGLVINYANTGFAVLLARISVERGDLDGALALLKRYETAAQDNAEYHGFVAAIYQRRNRHTEAIEQYQAALRLTSSVGAWWVGLGISQEASGRPKDATESFRRARATGNLSAELAAYAERRLKQIQ